MNHKKVTLLFTDLEGTILRESDGQYDDEAMFKFLEQIDNLQNNTDSEVLIHIVSPIEVNFMEEILDKLDRNIYSYDRIKQSNLKVPQGALASEQNDGYHSQEFLGDRILPLERIPGIYGPDLARIAKNRYAKSFIEEYKSNPYNDLVMCLYCGNGRNDLDAMKTVKRTGIGYVLCPKNSRTEARKIANFVSDKEDLPGLTECLKNLNRQLNPPNTDEATNNQVKNDIDR